MSKALRYSLIAFLIVGLITVRLYQEKLFYDPLLYFFEQNYKSSYLLNLNIAKHLAFVSLRYLINAVLSAGIIYLVFQKKAYVKISIVVFILSWAVFLPLYYYFIHTQFSFSLMIGFYVRRFLIQPIIGIILILALLRLQHGK